MTTTINSLPQEMILSETENLECELDNLRTDRMEIQAWVREHKGSLIRRLFCCRKPPAIELSDEFRAMLQNHIHIVPKAGSYRFVQSVQKNVSIKIVRCLERLHRAEQKELQRAQREDRTSRRLQHQEDLKWDQRIRKEIREEKKSCRNR